jgi:hypothetical protein
VIALGLSVLAGIVGIMGMLNIGPLGKYLFKASVTYRGDYWRAGINMFKHHWLFGVGLDRYGENFRIYRDAAQANRRGPDVISNAAHNVIIQLAATGGIFLLLTYLALLIFIGWRGVIALRTTSGANQIVVATVFGAWLAYQSQSFISIDNVGIAIWGIYLEEPLWDSHLMHRLLNTRKMAPSYFSQSSHSFIASILIVVSILFQQSEGAFRNFRANASTYQ